MRRPCVASAGEHPGLEERIDVESGACREVLQRPQKIPFGMCMLTSMWGTSTVSEIFMSPAIEQST